MEVTSAPAESSFFRVLATVKIVNWTSLSIYSEFLHTSKNFEGGLPRHILEKTTVFRKRVSNYGRLTGYVNFKCSELYDYCNVHWLTQQTSKNIVIVLFKKNGTVSVCANNVLII